VGRPGQVRLGELGKKVFVSVNQVVEGWENLPVTFWAIVPAAG
jgi:hypothetical protein